MSYEIAADAPTVLVTAVGAAEGARGAAAALACVGADVDKTALMVDLGGRAPRPTLIASTAARALEERLAAHLPRLRVAARGQVCHLAVAADEDGFAAAAAAVTVARGMLAVVHSPPSALQGLLGAERGLRPSGVLLRADVAADKALIGLVVRDLVARKLDVGVLKHRLGWVEERRAMFGILGSERPGLPSRLLSRLLSHECYAGSNATQVDPERAAQPERRDHARIGSR
ncbi:MAG TPA: hypothetical protein VHR18_03315 [Solirubrobacterales bacterium]|nr:hypothetical protein [Solirubrobacterales bacterium]